MARTKQPQLPPIDLRGAVCLDDLPIEAVTDALINGHTLTDVAKAIKASPASMLRWIKSDPLRSAAFEEAKVLRAEMLMQRVIALAEQDPERLPTGRIDRGSVADKHVAIQALRHAASKLAPSVYGEHVDVTSGGRPLMQDQQAIDARIAALMAKLSED